MLLLEHRKQGVSTAVIHNIWRITAEGESGRRVCSFSIISLHGTDLDLQGFCQLGHNNIIAYGTTPFQQILFVDGFHRFGQSQTVLRQTRSTPSRDVDMGGEHP